MSKQFTIHYACESLIPKRTSYITAISVCDVATKTYTSFSMEDAQKILGIHSIPQELEAYLLKQFFDFVSKHLDATWIHWHMNRLEYGFGVLQERYEMLWNQQASHFISTINLPDTIFEEIRSYCRKYPKMYQLFKDNRVHDQAILFGKEEAKLFEKAEFEQLKDSINTKAKALAMIYDKLQDKSLVTSCRRSDKTVWLAGLFMLCTVTLYMLVRG